MPAGSKVVVTSKRVSKSTPTVDSNRVTKLIPVTASKECRGIKIRRDLKVGHGSDANYNHKQGYRHEVRYVTNLTIRTMTIMTNSIAGTSIVTNRSGERRG